jgi:hypothetical protein
MVRNLTASKIIFAKTVSISHKCGYGIISFVIRTISYEGRLISFVMELITKEMEKITDVVFVFSETGKNNTIIVIF